METRESKEPGTGASPHDAVELLAGTALLIDIREANEWTAGHIPGMLHLSLDVVADQLGDLPGDRKAILVCRSGRRSAGVTELLLRSGFDAVNPDGGLLACVEAGLPLETDAGEEGRVA